VRCSVGDRIAFVTERDRGGGVSTLVVGKVFIVAWDAGRETVLTLAVLHAAAERMRALDVAA
jgi:hypothetical protein